MNDYLQAINLRRSRRSYSGIPINKEQHDRLTGLAMRFNQEAGLGISVVVDGSRAFDGLTKSYGMFSGVRTVIALVGKASDEHLKEKLGYYGELLVFEATLMQLGTCWVGGTFDKRTQLAKLGHDEQLECVITVGQVPSETFREKVIHKLAAPKSKPLEAFYTADTDMPDWILKGLEAVQKAPSAVNRQPVRFDYHEGVLRAIVDNIGRFGLIDLGIAKAHFSVATGRKFEWGNGGKMMDSLPEDTMGSPNQTI